jgi:hypothetical protein
MGADTQICNCDLVISVFLFYSRTLTWGIRAAPINAVDAVVTDTLLVAMIP